MVLLLGEFGRELGVTYVRPEEELNGDWMVGRSVKRGLADLTGWCVRRRFDWYPMPEADQEADARRGVGGRRSVQAKQELWGR